MRIAILILVVLIGGCGPVGPIPGTKLSGDAKPWPVNLGDVGAAEVIQLETRGPYVVNLWGAVADGRYYVVSSRGLSGWAKRIQSDSKVRLKVDDSVYEMVASPVDDIDERNQIGAAFRSKYELDEERDFPDTILYRLEPR